MTKPADSDQIAKARAFYKTLPHCCGYPNCDGYLVGLEHEKECPLFGKVDLDYMQFAAAFAASERQAVIEECAQVAEDPANREPGWSLSTQRMIARAIRSME